MTVLTTRWRFDNYTNKTRNPSSLKARVWIFLNRLNVFELIWILQFQTITIKIWWVTAPCKINLFNKIAYPFVWNLYFWRKTCIFLIFLKWRNINLNYFRGEVINGGFGLVLDGSDDAAAKAESMLNWDVSNGVARRYSSLTFQWCLHTWKK